MGTLSLLTKYTPNCLLNTKYPPLNTNCIHSNTLKIRHLVSPILRLGIFNASAKGSHKDMYLFNHEHIDNHFFNAGLSLSHLPSSSLVISSSSSSTNSSSSSELQLEQWPHLEQGLHNRLQPSSITYRSRRGGMFDWKARDLRKNEETSTTCFTTILPKPHFSTLVVCSPRLATTTCK